MSKKRIALFLAPVLSFSMFLVACSSSVSSRNSGSQTDPKTKDEDAIRKVMAEIDAAWTVTLM